MHSNNFDICLESDQLTSFSIELHPDGRYLSIDIEYDDFGTDKCCSIIVPEVCDPIYNFDHRINMLQPDAPLVEMYLFAGAMLNYLEKFGDVWLLDFHKRTWYFSDDHYITIEKDAMFVKLKFGHDYKSAVTSKYDVHYSLEYKTYNTDKIKQIFSSIAKLKDAVYDYNMSL